MNLHTLLDTYAPADATEQGYQRAMRALADQGPAGLRRDHYTPGHFTASAFVLSPDGQHLALIFHPRLKRWLQPGGHLEPGDASPLAACLREIAEETGIHAPRPLADGLFDIDLHTIPANPREPAHQHLDLRFAFQSETETLQGEHAARWVPLRAVHAVESDASVMRAVAKLLAARA